jgi:hypothetical protein
MQKKALTMLAALLISGLTVQNAAASEHHARSHRAHNQVMVGPIRYGDSNGFRVPLIEEEGGLAPSRRTKVPQTSGGTLEELSR